MLKLFKKQRFCSQHVPPPPAPSNYHYSKRGFAVSRPALMVLVNSKLSLWPSKRLFMGRFECELAAAPTGVEPSAGACRPGCSWDLKA